MSLELRVKNIYGRPATMTLDYGRIKEAFILKSY